MNKCRCIYECKICKVVLWISVCVNLCVCVSVLYVDLCGHVTLVHELMYEWGVWVCMYVFVLVLRFDGHVDGGGVCMPVQCWHCIHSGIAQAWLCNARMRRKAPRVLSLSLLAEALETRIPRDAWRPSRCSRPRRAWSSLMRATTNKCQPPTHPHTHTHTRHTETLGARIANEVCGLVW